jgi:hypothetical protein
MTPIQIAVLSSVNLTQGATILLGAEAVFGVEELSFPLW